MIDGITIYGLVCDNELPAKDNGIFFRNNSMFGSLHKWSNDGEHNRDDFTLNWLIDTLIKFCSRYGINPEINQLASVEYGCNIVTPFPAIQFVNDLMMYKSVEFTVKDKYAEASFKKYSLKIYAKEDNILKVEVHTQANQIKKFGIKYLSDVADPDKLKNLKNDLLNRWKNVVYYDSAIELEKIPAKYSVEIERYSNVRYWRKINNRTETHRRKKKFKELIKKYGKSGYDDINSLLENKLSGLLEVSPEKCNVFRDFLEAKRWEKSKMQSQQINNQKDGFENCNVFRDFESYKKNGTHSNKVKRLDTLDKGEICYISLKVCPISGIDISVQKKGSKFLCISGLKNLKKNNPEKYNELKNHFLKKSKYRDLDEKIQMHEIAHNIRNRYFNQIHNNRRDINRLINQKNTLFDNRELIDNKRLQLAGMN